MQRYERGVDMTELPHTAEALEGLDQSAFDALYQRVFDNRSPADPWRQLVEAEQKRRETLPQTDTFRQNFDAGVHQ